ncbi:MAG: glycosyl transferase [Cyanobacteria bacterium Co-bin8]|nr:glycosyl transferase [Cyanobacteria bacterium Co-bin8]
MARPTLYLAITNHGFGHATRAAAVAATVQQYLPEMQLILATTAPQWLFQTYLKGDFTLRQRAFDIGVIQSDSLTMDKPTTLAKLQEIRQTEADLVASEAAFLKEAGVDLVLADIPPLAVAIAHAAGVPCWMMSNFGWDFIYRPWGGEFEAIADWIAAQFGACDRMFRLPFHEPMSAFPMIEDVGLTGGNPRYGVEELRTDPSVLALSQGQLTAPPEKTVLLTFGGLGIEKIPYAGLAHFPDWQFLTFDQQAPDLPNLFKVPNRQLRPVDVMPLCSRVVSKPGFSTFSEACRLDLPIITLTREGFAEAPVLVSAMQDHAYHQVLTPAEFFEGDWAFLTQPLSPPRKDTPIAKNGNEQIAEAVVAYLRSPQ